MRKRAGSLVCLVLVTVAFAGAATAAAAGDTASTGTTEIKAAGISLRYPDTWTVMPRTRKEIAAQEKQLASSNPQLAQMLVDHAQLDIQPDTVKLRLVDLVGALNTGTSAGAIRVWAHTYKHFPSTLADFDAEYRRVADLSGGLLRIIKTTKLRIEGKSAYRVDQLTTPPKASDGAAIPDLRISRLCFARGTGDVCVDVTTAREAGWALADEILGSVRRI